MTRNDFEANIPRLRRKYLPIAKYILRRYSHEAEDALQKAFLKAFSRLDTILDDSNLNTWFRRVVTNTCIDELRRRSRASFVEIDRFCEDEEGKKVVNQQFSVPASQETMVLSQSLREKLPPAYRIVVEMRIQGWEHKQIAELLGLPENAVKLRLFRAVRMMRESYRRAVVQNIIRSKPPSVKVQSAVAGKA